MRQPSMSDRAAWGKIRPKSIRDRRQLLTLGMYVLLVALFVAGLFWMKQRREEDLDQNWNAATAVIEDVSDKPIEQHEGYGSVMLYQVSVLLRYSVNGSIRERWVVVDQRPVTLTEAKLQAFRWKGQQCTVRWKQSDIDHVIAEVS